MDEPEDAPPVESSTPTPPPDLPSRIEALLFASGHALSVPELADALRESDLAAVRHALKALQRAYTSRRGALEVRRVADRFALQLKPAFLETARPVAPTEMSPKTLRALSLIAYHQPLLQSQLVRMAGDGAYAEVATLRSLGFVRAERKGSTWELATTRAFAEHFGLESSRPEAIRAFLERRLGVVPVPPTPVAGPSDELDSAPSESPEPPASVVAPPVPGDRADTKPASPDTL